MKFNLELRPSRYFFTLISGFNLIVIFLSCIADLAWWMLLIIFALVIISYAYLLYKFIYRRSKYSIYSLWQLESSPNPHDWKLKFTNNKIKSATLKPKGYISNYLIIMHFRIIRESRFKLNLFKYKTVPVIIFPDMVDYSDYLALKRFLYGY